MDSILFVYEKLKYCFVFSLLLLFNPIQGQKQILEPCCPLIYNYTPEEFGADPKCVGILQDGRGMIYVANERGILEYDGVHWNVIPVGLGNNVQALGPGC